MIFILKKIIKYTIVTAIVFLFFSIPVKNKPIFVHVYQKVFKKTLLTPQNQNKNVEEYDNKKLEKLIDEKRAK